MIKHKQLQQRATIYKWNKLYESMGVYIDTNVKNIFWKDLYDPIRLPTASASRGIRLTV